MSFIECLLGKKAVEDSIFGERLVGKNEPFFVDNYDYKSNGIRYSTRSDDP